ncbi:MAG: YbdD/YjiX family protein [Gemmatimonadaceae bacterium]
MTDRIRLVVNSIARLLRAVLGAPDYDRYLSHTLAAHPGRMPMTRDQFFCERLENRYSKPGSRCC